jgi:ATP-binding cassette subfamily B (MDR/TAP) protein 1
MKSAYDPNFVKERNEWLIYWVILCCIIGIFNGLERTLIGVCGENLTYSVRLELIRSIMYKQLSWFDHESRAPGVLTGILSEDISTLNGMTTETLGVMVEAVMGLAFGVLIGIYFSWIQTFLVLLFSPIMIGGAIALSRL